MRRSSVLLAVSSAIAVIATATGAGAHIALMSPKPRYADLKEGPCGRGPTDKRSSNVTSFKSGETITVTWRETVEHPGHFRISFDADGVTAFVNPKSFTDLNTAPSVLVDGIADRTDGQTYSQEITLPDVECDNCTLQVIQVMTDKPPYGDGNDLYYQCADIVLAKSTTPGSSSGDDGGAGGSSGTTTSMPTKGSGGCTTTSRSPASREASILATLAIIMLARRRHSRQRRP